MAINYNLLNGQSYVYQIRRSLNSWIVHAHQNIPKSRTWRAEANKGRAGIYMVKLAMDWIW